MARALIAYFSLHGTTRRVAEAVAAGLAAGGIETTLAELRDGLPEDVAAYDIVGVGSPAHYFRLPSLVSEPLRRAPSLAGRATFAFTLQGSFRGRTLNELRTLLGRLGGTELGAMAVRGEGRYLPYQRLGIMANPGQPDDAALAEATAFGEGIARRYAALIADGTVPQPEPRDPRTHWMYALERLVTLPPLGRAVYSRFFRADAALCSKCGKCARVCPTRNIAFERGELPSWGRKCITCLECIAQCPKDAVRSPIDWWIFQPFFRYNVRRLRRQTEIPYISVVHRRGKTEPAER